jgi:hypothetical protein
MARQFVACKSEVHNRGNAPDAFLDLLIDWANDAPDEIFARNQFSDIYSSVVSELGPWQNLQHRKAAMLEVLRVLGGFESSWDWQADVDVNNPNSITPCSKEAGIFQCSGDSMSINPSLKALVERVTGGDDCDVFRQTTKDNHRFAIEYCARLLRFTTQHHGPVRDRNIHTWLRRDALEEFKGFLDQPLDGIFYPDAVKLFRGRMRERGTYPNRFPIGAIIHSTDGRPNDGKDSVANAVNEGLYAYFVIGRSGTVYQNFSLDQWGEHAGATRHPELGTKLSQKLVGIEVVAAGIVRQLDSGRYRPYYNEEDYRREHGAGPPKASDDFAETDVRRREVVGSRSQVGYQAAGHYHKFTLAQEEALIKLLRWMHSQKPDIFKYENVLGHDEVGFDFDSQRYGRKTDPGGALSMTMSEFRALLLSGPTT